MSGLSGLEEELDEDIWGRSESFPPSCSLRQSQLTWLTSCPLTQRWITKPSWENQEQDPVARPVVLQVPMSKPPGSMTGFHVRDRKERTREMSQTSESALNSSMEAIPAEESVVSVSSGLKSLKTNSKNWLWKYSSYSVSEVQTENNSFPMSGLAP